MKDKCEQSLFEYHPKIAKVLRFINEERKTYPSGNSLTIENSIDNDISREEMSRILKIIEGSRLINVLELEHPLEFGSYITWDIFILELDKFISFVNDYTKLEKNEENVGKVTFSSGGKVIYVSSTDKQYQAEFPPTTNDYRLLQFMLQNPSTTHRTSVLVKQINEPKIGGEDSTSDRRIRDTIQHIRTKLNLTGKNKSDDFFDLKQGLFGIKCNVEFKK